MSSILPLHDRNQHISSCIVTSNDNLLQVCWSTGVQFIENTNSFTSPNGITCKQLYRDAVHPNKRGASALAISIKRNYSSPVLRSPDTQHGRRKQQQSALHTVRASSPDSVSSPPPPPFTLSNFPHLSPLAARQGENSSQPVHSQRELKSPHYQPPSNVSRPTRPSPIHFETTPPHPFPPVQRYGPPPHSYQPATQPLPPYPPASRPPVPPGSGEGPLSGNERRLALSLLTRLLSVY